MESGLRIRVLVGDGFHAGDELEQWLNVGGVGRSGPYAVVSAISELERIATGGFAKRFGAWKPLGKAELWMFRTYNMRIGIVAPGDGRADTKDWTLAGSTFLETKQQVVALQLAGFVKTLADRCEAGKSRFWEL